MEPIKLTDFVKALKILNISSDCSQCGHSATLIPSTSKEPGTEELLDQTVVKTTTASGEPMDYDAIPIICGRCGYVRTFFTAKIKDIIDEANK